MAIETDINRLFEHASELGVCQSYEELPVTHGSREFKMMVISTASMKMPIFPTGLVCVEGIPFGIFYIVDVYIEYTNLMRSQMTS